MRVLHAPTDTAGHAWGLSRAERKLGIESTVAVYRSHWAGFGSDWNLHFERTPRVINLTKMAGLLAAAVARFDVLHFNWGSSLVDYPRWRLHHVDLPLLRRLGKRIVVTFQGSDARDMERAMPTFPVPADEARRVAGNLLESDVERRRRVLRIVGYADAVFVLNPDLCHDVPGATLLPYVSVDTRDYTPVEPREARLLRVGHAPTNRAIKGTRYVVEACERLQQAGTPVELVLIEGVPHDEVAVRLREVDLFVDQLIIGWYGAAAVEAMALGVPVLCYLRQSDLEHFVEWREAIPIVRTSPLSLADDLARLTGDVEERRRLAAAGRRYVEQIHDPEKVAARVIESYRA